MSVRSMASLSSGCMRATPEEKLVTFYRETFWANLKVFRCCQSALALAKRGENIDRCFIGRLACLMLAYLAYAWPSPPGIWDGLRGVGRGWGDDGQ